MWNSNQGINNVMVRLANRQNIVKLLYNKGELTKQEIVSELNLSLPTVNLIIQQLKDDNLVLEQPSDMSSGGRKPQLYSINYDAKAAVGVEISQNHNRLVLINLKNKLIDQSRVRIPFENTDEYWKGVSDRAQNMLLQNNIENDQTIGIGIAIPGVVKHDEEVVELAPTLNLFDFNFNKLKDIFNFPILVENEANAAGFAEVWNKDIIDNAIYISITKGVGGAVIVDNKIFLGDNGRSGEFGHMTLIPDGAVCSCGRKGCFEAYCSTKVLTQYSNGDVEEFFALKEKGNKGFQKVWDEYLDHLAIGISNIKTAFDTEIIIGGDLDDYIRSDYDKLYEKVRKRVLYKDVEPIFRISDTGKNASAIGSALLLISNYLDM